MESVASSTQVDSSYVCLVNNQMCHTQKLKIFKNEVDKYMHRTLSTVCAHCTSNKNQHALMLFNGNRFRHTASSVQVN